MFVIISPMVEKRSKTGQAVCNDANPDRAMPLILAP